MDIIGTDCDGYELEEGIIVRAIFYTDIDFEKEPECDPRHYCILRGPDGNYYLISVYDNWSTEAIKRHEKNTGEVLTIVKNIEEASNYEVGRDCDGNILYYEFNIEELRAKLTNILVQQKEQGKKDNKKIVLSLKTQ